MRTSFTTRVSSMYGVLLLALGLAACPQPEREIEPESDPAAEPAPERPGPPQQVPEDQDPTTQAEAGNNDLRFEISIGARELYVYRDDERIETHRVAVGREGHETPTGDFNIYRVDWNPDWEPPDSPWAEDFEYKEPGHPDNPMGRARLVFRPPYTIHGTSDIESLGTAASHGSVRVSNSVAMDLARMIMEHGGAGQSETWYQETMDNPTEMRQVEIPNPIPLRIRQ